MPLDSPWSCAILILYYVFFLDMTLSGVVKSMMRCDDFFCVRTWMQVTDPGDTDAVIRPPVSIQSVWDHPFLGRPRPPPD